MTLRTQLRTVRSKDERLETVVSWLREKVDSRPLDQTPATELLAGLLKDLKEAQEEYQKHETKIAELNEKISKRKKELAKARLLQEISDLLREINEVCPPSTSTTPAGERMHHERVPSRSGGEHRT